MHVVSEVLRARAESDPDVPYIRCGAEWMTHRELDERSDRLASGLASIGVTRGDRVAVIVPNRQEMVEVFFACAKLGAVQVPLNCFLKGDFLSHQLADSNATTLIADAAGFESARAVSPDTAIERVVHLDAVPAGEAIGVSHSYADVIRESASLPDVALRPSDLFAILYTSGTTGLPKGCMIPNGFYFGCAAANAEGDWVRSTDRLFTAFPLFHMGGQNIVMSALVNGASVCVEPEFSATTFMSRATEEGATVLFGVGPMAMALLFQPETPSDSERCFRMAMFVPLPPDFQTAFEGRFGTPVIAEGYGQTECSPATGSSLSGQRKRATAGRAVGHIELRIVDDDDEEVPAGVVGEIVIRPREPDVIYQGYWGRPEETLQARRNLWHHTGDSGRLDEEGFLTFVDRKSDSIRRRGENISSFEVEAAVIQHPGIGQVAVTAVPSPLGEDDIKATVCCAPDTELAPAELFEYLVDHLPYYAIPRYVEVRAALPTNALGRVMKYVLRADGVTESTWDFEDLGLAVPKEKRRGG